MLGGDPGDSFDRCRRLQPSIAKSEDFLRNRETPGAEFICNRMKGLAICSAELRPVQVAISGLSKMQIKQHIATRGRFSRNNVLLSGRCSGIFLNHFVRAALLCVVLAIIVLLVTS